MRLLAALAFLLVIMANAAARLRKAPAESGPSRVARDVARGAYRTNYQRSCTQISLSA